MYLMICECVWWLTIHGLKTFCNRLMQKENRCFGWQLTTLFVAQRRDLGISDISTPLYKLLPKSLIVCVCDYNFAWLKVLQPLVVIFYSPNIKLTQNLEFHFLIFIRKANMLTIQPPTLARLPLILYWSCFEKSFCQVFVLYFFIFRLASRKICQNLLKTNKILNLHNVNPSLSFVICQYDSWHLKWQISFTLLNEASILLYTSTSIS